MINNSYSSREKEVKVLAQYIPMFVFKVQRVIDQIRRRSYEETLMILELMPYRASFPILKLVYSAAANASHNMGLNEADSFISKAEVHGGPFVKKLRPRARGRSFPITRPTCQPKIIIPFGSPNQKNFLRVYKKMRKYGIVSRTMYKTIEKYP